MISRKSGDKSSSNTSKQPGSHWVLVLMSNPKYAIYYDSYGAQPPNEVKDYMKGYVEKGFAKNAVMTTSINQPLNGKGSAACGWFILNFLKYVIGQKNEPYDATAKITVPNTLAYGRRLSRKFLK